jgi:DNA-binding transcriptional ArsR family regulator
MKSVVPSRDRAAARMVEILDSPFLRALTEPARLEVLRVLLLHGPADIGTIAERLPQDRSVISRHLKTLEDAGVVRGQREGRHRIYEIDGPAFVTTLEQILGEVRTAAAICCPPTTSDVVPASRLKRR